MSNNRINTILLAVGLAILAVMVWMAGPQMLWHNILHLRWTIVTVVAVWGVGYLLNTFAWRAIVNTYPRRESLSFGRMMQMTVTGFAINYITPFGLLGGEPWRAMALRRYLGGTAAASAVLLYMLMHVSSHLLFWFMSCVLALTSLSGWEHNKLGLMTGILVFCTLLGVVVLRCYRRGMVDAVVRRCSGLPLVGERIKVWRDGHADTLRSVDDGVATLLTRHPAAFAASLGLELASRIVNCAEVWIVMRVLGHPVDYVGAVLIVAFSSLLANLLFFSPLQLATREGGIMLAVQWVMPGMAAAVAMPLALSVSMATRIREFIWIAVGLFGLKIYKQQ